MIFNNFVAFDITGHHYGGQRGKLSGLHVSYIHKFIQNRSDATCLEGNVAHRCFIVNPFAANASDVFDFFLLFRRLTRNGDFARAGQHFDSEVALVLALHFRLECDYLRLQLLRLRRCRNLLAGAARRRTRPFSGFRRLSYN